MLTSEVGVYNQSRGGYILLILPSLDVAESCKSTIFGQGDDSFGFHHLLGQILMRSLGYTCTTHLRSLCNGVENSVYILLVLRARYREAVESVVEKKMDRFRTVIDEYYSFINDYPDSKMRKEADNIFKIANKFVNGN